MILFCDGVKQLLLFWWVAYFPFYVSARCWVSSWPSLTGSWEEPAKKNQPKLHKKQRSLSPGLQPSLCPDFRMIDLPSFLLSFNPEVIRALLNLLGTKLLSSSHCSCLWVREWKQEPGCPWNSTPHFWAFLLRLISIALLQGILHLVLTRSAMGCSVCCPVDTLLQLSHRDKQPFFVQWHKAEQLSLVSLVSCVLLAGICSMCTKARKWWSMKAVLKELLKEMKAEILPIISHTP